MYRQSPWVRAKLIREIHTLNLCEDWLVLRKPDSSNNVLLCKGQREGQVQAVFDTKVTGRGKNVEHEEADRWCEYR